MKVVIGKDDNMVVCSGCGNKAEVSESMISLLDIAMKLEVKGEKCGEKLEVVKEGTHGEEKKDND